MTLLFALATLAPAADETDLPPALRGDVAVAWRSDLSTLGLAEDALGGALPAGRRTETAHVLALRATFAPVDGVALIGGLEHQPGRSVAYRDARRMLEDPATGTGSTAGGASIANPDGWSGAGLLGWTVGVAFAPYAERRAEHVPVTWRLDLAVRSAPPRTLWELDSAGRGGAGDGGPTIRAGAAFSRQYDTTSPYLVAAWEVATPRFVGSTDAWGDPIEIQVDPGQRLDVRGGVEVRLTRDPSSPNTANLDLSTGFGWRSAARVPSGVFLPDVLASSRAASVVSGEQLGWLAGFGVESDIATAARLRLWSHATWVLPHRVEHPYKVWTTADSVRVALGAEVILRWR